MKRVLASFGVVAVSALSWASLAMAQTTDPPTVDAADLTPILYGVAAALLAAVLLVLGPVFLSKVPFAVVNIVRKAIHKLMGRATPSAG